jgi:hypothetical protein
MAREIKCGFVQEIREWVAAGEIFIAEHPWAIRGMFV